MLHKNKPQIPPEFTASRKREPQSMPKKYKNVLLISSFHSDGKIYEGTGDLKKPEIITFYSHTKGGIDTVDKHFGSFNVAVNTNQWPLMVFFSMVNVAAINSFIIWDGNTSNNFKRRKYIKYLSNELVQQHVTRRSTKYIEKPKFQAHSCTNLTFIHGKPMSNI
ncbi:uncharacterized protein LOC126263368 [Schistocerca nitens]|uniref:uncharacterized protein LOC126263368 n=1 Tax=Schistocerca nitens TaxID=7011 RepID=UPI00211874E9|nr:uncharacterized protein LOC126263368 [Schistocerca nitens]